MLRANSAPITNPRSGWRHRNLASFLSGAFFPLSQIARRINIHPIAHVQIHAARKFGSDHQPEIGLAAPEPCLLPFRRFLSTFSDRSENKHSPDRPRADSCCAQIRLRSPTRDRVGGTGTLPPSFPALSFHFLRSLGE